MEKIEKHKSNLGNADANFIACIPYVGVLLGFLGVAKWFCWIVPLVIFFVEKKSSFVKKNAIMALILNFLQIILYGIVYLLFSSDQVCYFGMCQTIDRYLTSVGNVLLYIVSFLALGISLFSIYKAFMYEVWDIPIIDKIGDKLTGGLNKIQNSNLVKRQEVKSGDSDIEEVVIDEKKEE